MSLLAHAKRIAQAADRTASDTGEDRFPADDADAIHVQEGLAGRQDARDVLPMAALLQALGSAGLRRIQGREGLALVVEVPSADWASRIETALRDLGSFATIVTRTGASRAQDRPTEGNAGVACTLARNARVAGVSHAPARYLPATLVQAADMVVRVRQPDNRVIAAVIRAVTGKRPRRIPPAVAAGLGFDDITAALRIGSTPASCITRLQAASGARSGGDALGAAVPDLADLHGYGAAMEYALALVQAIEEWRQGRLPWADVPRTATLWSEPGLGKSSLIRSIAKTARLPLVSANVGDFFTGSNGHLDGVLKAMEATIARAASMAPAILFLDELDSIPNRDTMDNRGRDWWTPVVNAMLAALDSTTSGDASRLVVIGATNHADKLDPALIRPGRLHPVIRIERPDAAALAGILRQHLGPLDLPGIDLLGVAQLGVGGTGADVTAWVKGARAAARAAGRRMVQADLVAQVAPPDTRTAEEIRTCALHEAGHAVIAVTGGLGTLTSVTIVPRRTIAGSAVTRLHARAFLTRRDIEAIAIMALAGRAMDALAGVPHTGAGGGHGSDLQQATELVVSLHAAYGLGDSLLYHAPSEAVAAMRHDPVLRRAVEADLMRLFAEATRRVREHRGAIEAVADRLVEARVLSGEEVVAIIDRHPAPKGSGPRRGRHAR